MGRGGDGEQVFQPCVADKCTVAGQLVQIYPIFAYGYEGRKLLRPYTILNFEQ